jgi:L-fuculose-phosphate aldolase
MFTAYKKFTLTLVDLVNAPRGVTYDQYRDRLLLKVEQQQQFIDTARWVVERQLALGTLGELSLRLSAHQLAITRRDSHLAWLTKTDIVTCSTLSGKPNRAASRHLDWHRLIYRETSAQAVLFCQPKYALTLANAARLPQPRVLLDLEHLLGRISLHPPAEPTEESLAEAGPQHEVLLLPHRGALIWGDSLAHVLARAEALDYISHLTALSFNGCVK